MSGNETAAYAIIIILHRRAQLYMHSTMVGDKSYLSRKRSEGQSWLADSCTFVDLHSFINECVYCRVTVYQECIPREIDYDIYVEKKDCS